jgi:uncharacterized protein (TIGR03435 family)
MRSAFVTVCSFLLACNVMLAQAGDSMLAFDVATLKPSGPQGRRMFDGGPGSKDPGRVRFTKATMQDLLAHAYGVDYFQIVGPAWFASAEFDLEAKVPEGATKEQFKLMQQSLLAERFHLVLHHETRDFPAYDLVVAKGGTKLKESAASTPAPASSPPPSPFAVDKNGFPQLPPGVATWAVMNGPGHSRLAAHQQPASALTIMLSPMLRRPILDKTGLTKLYDYTMDYNPRPDAAAPPADNGEEPAPDISVAIQQQLGLKLEDKKEPFDVLVIDPVDRTPAEN